MRQKTLLSIILVALFMSLLVSCDDETGKNLLKLDKESITLTHNNAPEIITVTSGAEWTILDVPDWIEVTPTASNQLKEEVTIIAQENKTFEQRSATIVFVNGGTKRTLKVTQLSLAEADAFIQFNTQSLAPTSLGDKYVVEVAANRPWKLKETPDWISISPTSGDKSTEVTIIVKESREINNRLTELIFETENTSASLPVIQRGLKDIVRSPDLNLFRYANIEFSTAYSDVHVKTNAMFVKPSIKDNVFLGNLVSNNLDNGTTLTPLTGYTFKPITVSTGSIISGVYSKTFTPSLAEQTTYAQHVTSFKPEYPLPMTTIDENPVSFYSYRFLHLAGLVDFGVKLDEIVTGSSYTAKEMDNEYGLIFGFRRPVFSLDMDLPPADGSVIKEQLKEADKNKGASYISSVSYGQVGLLIMTSKSDLLYMKDIMRKVKKNTPLSSTESSLIESAQMTYVYFDNNSQVKTVKGTLNALSAYVKAVTSIDYDNVYPIGFGLADFNDHTISEMSFSVKPQ